MGANLWKSECYGLDSERKKVPASSPEALTCVLIHLGAFWSLLAHLPSQKSILPYFSSPRGVAILGCESHSQAGSARPRCCNWMTLTLILGSAMASFTSRSEPSARAFKISSLVATGSLAVLVGRILWKTCAKTNNRSNVVRITKIRPVTERKCH